MSYQQLWEQDKNHVLHPWMDMSVFKENGCDIMIRGDGVYVEDAKGGKYIDGMGGLWCVNVGFNNQRMKDAIVKQLDEIVYFSPFTNLTTPPAAKLGAKLAEISPKNLNHVFFSTGGSMANDSAVRIVHLYNFILGRPKKNKIISRFNSYHGSGFLASALTGTTFNHTGWQLPKDLVYYVSEANVYRPSINGMSEEEHCNYLVKEFEDKINEIGNEEVAAFIAEPIVGAGGVLVAPKGYHKLIKEVCEKYEVLYISDEVVTSFGRLGHFFASEEVFGVSPDIITTAKGITSGYVPLGATMISDEIYEVISKPQVEGGLFTHGFTYSGHPISCAAALENIKIIEDENLLEHVRTVGKYFENKVKELERIPIVGNVRGSHFMIGLEQVANKKTKELFPAELQIGKRIAKEAQKRGLIVRPIGHLCVLSPAIILTKEQIDKLVSILEESLLVVTEKVKDYLH
jgi:putrescine aminotransferase